MSTDQDKPAATDLPHRFQFSLATLLWIMTGTAILSALLFRIPASIADTIMLVITLALLPAVWMAVPSIGR